MGRHFWDLHPHCSVASLTSHGAVYFFDSLCRLCFLSAICGGGSECANATSMVLSDTLRCTGGECGRGVSHVRWIRGLHIQQASVCGLGTHERRRALLKVETLLVHLFRHYYTLVHVAKRESFLVLSLQTLRLPTSDL